MKRLLSIIFLLYFGNVFSQDLIYKKDIVYGKAPDWHNNVQNLSLDVIYPANTKKLPLIVFVHGGGFIEDSKKENSTPFCERLAKNGFVVANVEYRTGFEHSFTHFKTEITKAVYRAEQDQLAAVRYLVHHTSQYPIDTSAIFIAGESAGGVASLFSAYVNQDDWDSIAAPLHQELGSISNSGNELTDQFKLKGVISLWGGIADTSFISKQQMHELPVLLFHSIDDADVPFELASHPKAKQQFLLGSRDIGNRFKNNNSCYQLYFIHGAAHSFGFSSDYLSNAIRKFVADVLEYKCSSSEIENKGNINISFTEADSDTIEVEDKTITLSPETLQQYAGQYEGMGFVISISVDNDHLKVEAPREETHQLYPVKKDIFVEKKLHVQATFRRDAKGNVIEHEILLTRNRQNRFKKIN